MIMGLLSLGRQQTHDHDGGSEFHTAVRLGRRVAG
jgi:hypothetical protein